MTAKRHSAAVAAAAVIGSLILAAFAVTIATQVSVWLDEVVQMAGLRLSPARMIEFLTAKDWFAGYFPSDHGTPLNYWLGWVWASVFGLSELSMRCLGIALGMLACGLCAALGARLGGVAGAWVAALSFATSPNVLIHTVGIRYYPLFLCASAASFYFFVGWWTDAMRREGWIVALSISLFFTIQTHAFGVVLATALWGMILYREGWHCSRATKIGLFGSSLSFLASTPFLWGKGLTASTQTDPAWFSALRVIYRCFAHAAIAVSPVALLALCGGLGVAIWLVLKRRNAELSGGQALVCVIAFGLAITAATAFIIPSGVLQQPRYSIWMLPGLAGVLAAAVGAAKGKYLARAAVLLAIVANAYGALVLSRNASLFWMSNYRDLQPLLECRGKPADVIVHDRSASLMLSSVLWHYAGTTLRQFVSIDADGGVRSLPTDHLSSLADLRGDCVAVMHADLLRSADLRQVMSGSRDEPARAVATRFFDASEHWQLEKEATVWSMVAARVSVYRRK